MADKITAGIPKDKKDRLRRNKVFEVRIVPDRWSRWPDEVEVQYTKNGFQMTSFSLLPEEMDEFIKAMVDYKERVKKGEIK